MGKKKEVGCKVMIQYSRASLKFLRKLDRASVGRIRSGIAGLTRQPPEGDIKPLRGYQDGRKRLRIGDWRVIFRNDMQGRIEILLIIDIGNRGDIYK